MSEVKILVLNFAVENVLCETLHGILKSSSRLHVFSQQATIEDDGHAFNDLSPLSQINAWCPDLIFLLLPATLLKEASILIPFLKDCSNKAPIIVVNEGSEPEDILALLRFGINDYIIPPLKPTDIFPRIWRLLEKPSAEIALTQILKEKVGLKQIVGESQVFIREINKIPAIAKCDASVLILGETGTGKEVCARAIHYLSLRTGKPFIPINCAAIPVDLLENELFGHERGAFTGAATTHYGLIHEADGGTLFLDEIDCLPLLAQVKLLRFLQEKEYRPLGSTKKCEADVRVIAASNVNVETAVQVGKFRQDLYYRLNVIPLALPPLRERQEDILLLARHFLAKHVIKFHKETKDLAPDAIQRLLQYDWPGNVRELEHIIERALVFSDQPLIRSADLSLPDSAPQSHKESFNEAKSRLIERFERSYIQELLLAHHGNITKAAQAAKKNRRAFWQLIRKHHINVQSFKPRANFD